MLRIDRVFEFIDDHLDDNLNLESIAKIALFSPYHFHRVFKYVTNETLNAYVLRRRVEKAAIELIHREAEIGQIARLCGFNDGSSFTRSFKRFYGVSPSEFKKQHNQPFSKIRILNSKNGQSYPDYDEYLCIIDNLKKWLMMQTTIDIKEVPSMDLAAVTHIGMNQVEQGFDTLIRWANGQGLMRAPDTKLGRLFYDSVKVTAPDQVRMKIFLHSDQNYELEGQVHALHLDESTCIVGRFEIHPSAFERAWTSLFVWMNEQGYKKGKQHPFEMYHNDYREHPEGKCIVDLHIPIL